MLTLDKTNDNVIKPLHVLTIAESRTIQHRNRIVITVDGYFGDGDEYFHLEESYNYFKGCDNLMRSKYGRIKPSTLIHDLMMLNFIEENRPEEKKEVGKYLAEFGIDIENDDQIECGLWPGASWDSEICGHIDTVSVMYYNELGTAFPVTCSES